MWDVLCELFDCVGIFVVILEENGGFCCGMFWKLKGYFDGYVFMVDCVLDLFWEVSRYGEFFVVCDVVFCIEGLDVMFV